MAKTASSTSTSAQRDAARAARNDRVQEVVYLLAWLTRLNDFTGERCVDAHLSMVDFDPGALSTMNYVVCIHDDDQRLAWRISDFEALEYFKHLSVRQCPRGLSRADKMAYLADMLSRKG